MPANHANKINPTAATYLQVRFMPAASTKRQQACLGNFGWTNGVVLELAHSLGVIERQSAAMRPSGCLPHAMCM